MTSVRKISFLLVLLLLPGLFLVGCVNEKGDINAKYSSEDLYLGQDKKIRISIGVVDVMTPNLGNVPEEIILRDSNGNEYHYSFLLKKEKLVK